MMAETCVANGVMLCTAHHLAVHEGGYTIERIDQNKQVIDELFEQQHNKNDIAQFDIEEQLRNDRESFDTVRKLSPTHFRLRVLDKEGGDVRTLHYRPNDYTRVYCAEPIALYITLIECHASSSSNPISPISQSHKQPCCSTAA